MYKIIKNAPSRPARRIVFKASSQVESRGLDTCDLPDTLMGIFRYVQPASRVDVPRAYLLVSRVKLISHGKLASLAILIVT